MKKLLFLFMSGILVFNLVGCGNTTINNQKQTQIDHKLEDVSQYDNVGFNTKQQQVIAEEIGITSKDDKVVFMYVVEADDKVIYYDVYDEFNGTACRYREYIFCKDQENYENEMIDAGDYDEVVKDSKNYYVTGIEQVNFSWAGSWQDIVDYHNEHQKPYNDEYIMVEE